MRFEIHYSYKCNQDCIFCPVLRHPKEDPFLKDMLKVLKYIKKGDRVDISGGEPLVRSDISKLAKAIKKRTDNIYITTNAMLLNKKIVEKLIKSGVNKFLVSFHSHDPQITKKITNKSSFKHIYKNLKLLSNYNVEIITNTIITKYNANTIIDTLKFLEKNISNISKYKITYPRFYKFKNVDFSCKNHLLSLNECTKYLAPILKLPQKIKSKVSIENIPQCVLKHKNNNLDWNASLLTSKGIISSLDNIRYFTTKCVGCKLKKDCQGFHKFYNLYFDDFILEGVD